MLIGGKYIDLVISRKSIHEREDDTSSTFVGNLIDMQSQKIAFGTSFVQVSKIDADSNGALLFIDGDNNRYPFRQGYKINKPSFEKFLYLNFNSCGLPWMDLPFFFLTGLPVG